MRINYFLYVCISLPTNDLVVEKSQIILLILSEDYNKRLIGLEILINIFTPE
jgi:hypothetical protein